LLITLDYIRLLVICYGHGPVSRIYRTARASTNLDMQPWWLFVFLCSYFEPTSKITGIPPTKYRLTHHLWWPPKTKSTVVSYCSTNDIL
jgi:hypothetical protein